jgi:hypothetical protein
LGAYEAYLSSQLKDYDYPDEQIQAAMKDLPEVEFPA